MAHEDEEEQKPENQKSPILNGVVKAGSETTPDAQAEHEVCRFITPPGCEQPKFALVPARRDGV